MARSPRPQLLLVDGNSLLHRAYHALPPLTTSDGRPTNAVYGLATMLVSLLEQHPPQAALVAFDAPGPTHRHEEYAEYKATRKAPAEDLVPQFALARQLVAALGLEQAELSGWEADDLIAGLAQQAAQQGYEVLVVTGDRDLVQLVDEHVKVLATIRGVADLRLYDRAQVEKEYGLTPEQIPDLKGLAGDSSDNLPGVRGVGPKTALTLLQKYGSVEGILEHTGEVTPPRLQQLLTDHGEEARLYRRLAKLEPEKVPVEFAPAQYAWHGFDRELLRELLLDLEFSKLLQRLEPRARETDPPAMAPAAQTGLATVLQEARSQGRLQVAAAWHGATLLGLAVGEDSGQAAYVPTVASGGDSLFPETAPALLPAQLTAALGDPALGKRGPELKTLSHGLRELGVRLRGYQFDPAVGDYVLASHRRDHGMDMLALQYLGEHLPARAGHEARAVAEVRLLPALEGALRGELRSLGLEAYFDEVEMPLAPVLAEMEAGGVAVATAALQHLDEVFARELERLSARMYEIAGVQFNPDSPQQVGEILFSRLGLPGGKKTKTGWGTGAEVLDALAQEHEIARLLLEYREYAKLRSTYVKGLLAQVDKQDGRVHTTLEQTVTATGRLSSRNPNLQNIPIRTDLGREIRACFVAGQPERVLLSADYSQIELRLLAHFSGAASLVEAFRTEQDVHRASAAIIFGIDPRDVTERNRRIAKTVNYAVIYGQGAGALATQIGVSRSEAENYIRQYFERLAGVKQYLDLVVRAAEEQGYVETLTGRRRYLPELRSSNQGLRAYAQRAAANSVLQGSAADIIKIAMVRMAPALAEAAPTTQLLLQVHDELLFELPASELAPVAARVKEIMEGATNLVVPLVVELKAGPNWRDMVEVRI
jgi:DNA polymerase-1